MAEKNVIITYETLYEVLRNEKTRTELQKLDESFFNDLIKYIGEKRAILESQERKESIFTSIEVQKTRKQLENIHRIVKELYEKREGKLMQLALIHTRSPSNSNEESNLMLKEELKVYDKMLNMLSEARKGILNNILKGREPVISQGKPKDLKIDMEPQISGKKIKITDSVPEFVGVDSKTYGPFKKEETQSVPLEIADLLIKRKKAIEAK